MSTLDYQLSPFFTHYQAAPSGLTNEEAESRLKKYGRNQLQAKKKTPYIVQFFEEFKDLMVIILVFATIFAFWSGEIVDAIIILFIVFLNATIGFIQKFKAEKAIEALKKMIKPYARVLRNGIQTRIAAEELAPGDIIVLEEGDTIAADAVLFEANELETQEAILTGESTPVEKNPFGAAENISFTAKTPTENSVFMGTMCVHGTGTAVVANTGMNTEIGRIALLTTETKKDKSPLEKELQNIGFFVGKITLAITALLFAIGFLIQKREVVSTLLFATSVAVAAVPEGLPTTITIALAVGAQRLAKNKAIIKQLSAVETLGATTVICTDKTGTLTRNEMTVKEIYFDRFHAIIKGVGYKPQGIVEIKKGEQHIANIGKSDEENDNFTQESTENSLAKLKESHSTIHHTLELLLLTAGLCNKANIEEENGQWKAIGDPTESALITMVEKCGFNLVDLKYRFEKIHEFPFDSTRKLMTVLMKEKSTQRIFVLSKGAPGNILKTCRHVILNNNNILIDKSATEDFLRKNEEMASNALRCLAFAYKELSQHESKKILSDSEQKQTKFKKEDFETDMIFLGITGMLDPPRPEVKEAIELTHRAGIKIYMITGDHGLTAEAIAKQIGLLNSKTKYRIVSGDELEKTGNVELKNLLGNKELEIIFARISPQHKLRIVSALKELGEVVAVTGDGVNDAPALKRADIGVAMGISGTDVSKEASNMILSDDSFGTIVTAIKEGRTIYENLKKFIFYIFSSNISELFIIFSAILLNLPAPLTAVLILIINLTTDILPALALGIEPTEAGIMNKKPRNVHQKILNKHFIQRIMFIGISSGVIMTMVYLWQLNSFGFSFGQPQSLDADNHIKAISITFAFLTMLQMANTLNARSERLSIFKIQFFSNTKLLWAILSSILITVVIIEIPFLQKYFHTTSLTILEWFFVSIMSFLIIGVEEIRKLLAKRLSRSMVHLA